MEKRHKAAFFSQFDKVSDFSLHSKFSSIDQCSSGVPTLRVLPATILYGSHSYVSDCYLCSGLENRYETVVLAVMNGWA